MKYEVLDLSQFQLKQGFGIRHLDLTIRLNTYGKYIDHFQMNGRTYIIVEIDDDQDDSHDDE